MEKFKPKITRRGGSGFNLPRGGGGVGKRGAGRFWFHSAPWLSARPPPFQQLRQQPLQQQQQFHQRQQQRRLLVRRRAAWQTARRRGSTAAAAVKLHSSDPLNLRWVAAESQRRELAGLSPMPGDSALGSPVLPTPEGGGAGVVAPALPTVPLPPYQARRVSVGGFKRPAFFQPIYGNYRAYYGKRLRAGDLNIGQLQDDRLELLQPDWYLERDVLDIGCNDGVLSLKIAETLGVRSLTGIDIDGHLVQRAQRNLRLCVREAEADARVKRRLALEGFEVQPPLERKGFPYNVYFQAGNYVLESEAQLDKVEESRYDIIQAFSITKWVHLNWGDAGLKLFFRRAFKELKPDGKLILEPQPYQSYRKKLLCPAHKRNYADIQLRPEHFRDYLEREVGFAHILSVSEQQRCHGFQRPVLMCTKPTGRTPAPSQQPPPPLLPRSRLADAEAEAAAADSAASAMAAASSAAETPESLRLTLSPHPAEPLDISPGGGGFGFEDAEEGDGELLAA